MAMAIAGAECVSHCCHIATTSSSYSEHVSRTIANRLASPIARANRLFTTRSQSVHAKAGRSEGAFSSVVKATLPATEEAPLAEAEVARLKSELLAAVAGLDRGLMAAKADEDRADSLAIKLEAAGGPIVLPEDLDKFQGRWRLIFSSGFNTGSLGGQRPGPSISRLPLVSIGLVYQRIDVPSRELDNIVDLNISTPWPLPTIQVTTTLAHSFELSGGPNITITLEKTILKPAGSLSSVPSFELPQIQIPDFVRTPRGTGSGEFSTTYIDKDFRISRGDRGELRIFVRS